MGVSMIDDQIEIVGWRYEVYSARLDRWEPVTTFTQTAPEIRQRAPRIRRLTPLVAYDAVIATQQPDTEISTDRHDHTADGSTHRKHTVAVARNGHADEADEAHD